MPERSQQTQRFVEKALQLPAEQRRPFLDGVSAVDPALGHDLEALFAARHPTITSLPELDITDEQEVRMEGRHLGPYRVVRELGRGGGGAVYLAERDDAEFHKTVAIKVLRRGEESADIVMRFRRERQILATLDHPFIAKLHDGGTTDAGLPYFVMEHVVGRPIDEYCDARRLSVTGRLELFRKVCEAVHFAHQNLVVHRDLKPANILVTEDGTPKLLDFGIAKPLTPEPQAPARDTTRIGMRPMTPEYASPEQVKGEPVTTASDVYSLGVVLYELLTGHRPYRIDSSSLHEIARIICEHEPARPSAAVARPEASRGPDGSPRVLTPEAVSRARGLDPDRLQRRLAGDLDTIVSMAMRKEARRRYASATELGEDVRRHLDGLPVVARADTFAYRAGKFVRRHRAGVAVAAVFLFSLAAFGATMAVQSARIAAQRNRAEAEAAKARAINEFLQTTLGAANPTEGVGRDVTVLESLGRAAATIEKSFAGQPETEAAVKNTIGFTYLRLARYDEAEPLLRSALEIRRSLAERHPDLAESLTSMGGLLLYRGDYEAAEGFFREALALQRERLGPHPEVAASLNDLAVSLNYQGRNAEAEPLYREALALRRELLGPEHPTVAETLNNLAFLLHDKGDYEAAEKIYREVVAMDRKLLGKDHPNLAIDLDNFASLLDDKGDYEAAEPLFREALAIRRDALGGEHPDVAKSLNNLAAMLERKGEYETAGGLYREAIAIRRKLFEGPHPDLATNLNNLARLLTTAGKPREALPLFREAQSMYRATLGEEHWLMAGSRVALGNCLAGLGRYGEAEGQLLAGLERLRAGLGEEHERTRIAVDSLVKLYEAWGKPEAAAEYRTLVTAGRAAAGS